MNKQTDIVVTNEMVRLQFPRVNEDGRFKTLTWNGDMAHGTFERYDTRFEVSLTKLIDSEYYVCAVHNFYFSHYTSMPWNIAYKVAEKDIPSVDAESIEVAMRYMCDMMMEYARNN